MTFSIDLRCAVQTAAQGAQIAGTASAADRWVLLELPGPWPKPALAHPLLASLTDPMELTGSTPGVDPTDQPTTHRTLLIADDTTAERTADSGHRIVVWDRDATDGPTGFRGRETTVARSSVAAAAFAAARGELDDDLELVSPGRRDVAICTQGTHDRCCGSMGTRFHGEAAARFAGDPTVRMWRTSHTGGHRFAPTGLTFPDGMTWAGLDLGTLDAALHGVADLSAAADRLRGCAFIADRGAQLIDIEGVRRHGAAWLAAPRTWHRNGDDVTVVARLNGRDAQLSGTVVAGRTLPVPPCGESVDAAVKSATELVLAGDIRT